MSRRKNDYFITGGKMERIRLKGSNWQCTKIIMEKMNISPEQIRKEAKKGASRGSSNEYKILEF